MRGARRAALAASALAFVACAKSPADDGAGNAAAPSADLGAAPQPVDHLAPGEIAEGTDRVFGLLLPRALHLDSSFPELALASGSIVVHPLVKYFRAHLQGGTLDEGDTSATFENATIPGASGRTFRVHIQRAPRGSLVEIRDTTPPPYPNLPDEAARWKAAGVTPNGHVIEPNPVN